MEKEPYIRHTILKDELIWPSRKMHRFDWYNGKKQYTVGYEHIIKSEKPKYIIVRDNKIKKRQAIKKLFEAVKKGEGSIYGSIPIPSKSNCAKTKKLTIPLDIKQLFS